MLNVQVLGLEHRYFYLNVPCWELDKISRFKGTFESMFFPFPVAYVSSLGRFLQILLQMKPIPVMETYPMPTLNPHPQEIAGVP